jgi:hypothetical protein
VGQTIILLILLVVYPVTSREVFQTFDCLSLDTGTDNVPFSVLRSDFAFQCHTPTHQRFIGLAATMALLYSVGIPLLLMAVIWHASKATRRLGTSHDNRAGGGAMPPPFVTSIYLDGFRYFEVGQLLVRLFLSALIVVVFSGQSALQAVYVLSVSLVGMAVLARCMPYRLWIDNVLAIATYGCLAVTAVCMLTSSQVGSTTSTAAWRTGMEALMGCVMLLPLVLALLAIGSGLWQWLHVRHPPVLTWDEGAALDRVTRLLSTSSSSSHSRRNLTSGSSSRRCVWASE